MTAKPSIEDMDFKDRFEAGEVERLPNLEAQPLSCWSATSGRYSGADFRSWLRTGARMSLPNIKSIKYYHFYGGANHKKL